MTTPLVAPSRRRPIRSAIARTAGAGLTISDTWLATLAPGELLVRLEASGICHTDLAVLAGRFALPLPYVLGHEGIGTVVAAGGGDHDTAIGTRVVLTFESCGACARCAEGHPAYCRHFDERNYGRTRTDGEAFVTDADGAAIGGRFFGQSSFATYALVTARNAVPVPAATPTAALSGMGCGFLTWAGAVETLGPPPPRGRLAVLGMGPVGFTALFMARERGWDRGGGRHDRRRAGSRGGGAALARSGTLVLLGAGPERVAAIDVVALLRGRTIRGEMFGDADPHALTPRLVALHAAGRFPVDRLVTGYSFERIGDAVADLKSGAAIKALLTF